MISLSIKDFYFFPQDDGSYTVIYVTKSGRKYRATVDDKELIDATKNAVKPRVVDLERLRSICRQKPCP